MSGKKCNFASENNLNIQSVQFKYIDTMEIKIVEDYRVKYEFFSAKSPNSNDSIAYYHNWYDASRVLFDEYCSLLVFNNNDPEFLNFLSVKNNEGNGFILQSNFYKIRGSYLILLNRIKNWSHQTNNNNKINSQAPMKQATARFVERLGLNAIILHEQPNSGRTIIQKLLDETNNSSYGIVLYSPCDEGKSKEEKELHPRARQNVVFEHGLLIGKLGINRVCCLYKGNVDMPSDNNGVLYIPYDENEGWKHKLVKEMKSQGMPINMESLI